MQINNYILQLILTKNTKYKIENNKKIYKTTTAVQYTTATNVINLLLIYNYYY